MTPGHTPAVAFAAILAIVAAGDGSSDAAGATPLTPLTLEQRVACQERLERLDHAHRVAAVPEPKPSFDAAIPAAAIRAKVERSLALSAAFGIGPAQLQAELDRMARATRQPERLREMFAALDDDPYMIAECLVRPRLAARMAMEADAGSETRAAPRSARPGWGTAPPPLPVPAPGTAVAGGGYTRPAITGGNSGPDDATPERVSVPDGRSAHTAIWTGAEMIVWGGTGPGNGNTDSGGRYDPATDSWMPTATGADVPAPRSRHTAVWTGIEMIVWGGRDARGALSSGGRYNPATDTWRPTIAGANTPSRRVAHTAVWTGREMIVWGGRDVLTNSGGRYDPATDTWAPMRVDADTPTPRSDHAAVWTGREMIVWGGQGNGIFHDTGARYDPVADRWTPTGGGPGLPSARYAHTAVWSGTQMIVWGGAGGAGSPRLQPGGGRYDPVTDTWAPIGTGADVASGRLAHTAVWTGTRMIAWGGFDRDTLERSGTGAQYDPVADVWTPTKADESAPAARDGHSAVWTGTEMIVWGGHTYDWDNYIDVYLRSGGRYEPAADDWVPTNAGENSPPRADAGPDQVVECTGKRQAITTLDGSRSSDADSTPGTNDDIVLFRWKDEPLRPLPSGAVVAAPLALGPHTVSLTVVDRAGAAHAATALVTVRDTRPPAGEITDPAAGQCFGPDAVPVTVRDDFADACEPKISRSYEPAGGPSYATHGDLDVTLTATDPGGNAAQASVGFTIDLVPPAVALLPRPGRWIGLVPFDRLFTDADDDGARGAVVHEAVALDGCVVYDGLTYGDGDGLLLDETAPATQDEMCRIVELCGKRSWQDPLVTVTAADCGGNAATVSAAIPGSFQVPASRCRSGEEPPAGELPNRVMR